MPLLNSFSCHQLRSWLLRCWLVSWRLEVSSSRNQSSKHTSLEQTRSVLHDSFPTRSCQGRCWSPEPPTAQGFGCASHLISRPNVRRSSLHTVLHWQEPDPEGLLSIGCLWHRIQLRFTQLLKSCWHRSSSPSGQEECTSLWSALEEEVLLQYHQTSSLHSHVDCLAHA